MKFGTRLLLAGVFSLDFYQRARLRFSDFLPLFFFPRVGIMFVLKPNLAEGAAKDRPGGGETPGFICLPFHFIHLLIHSLPLSPCPSTLS